jgi:hypothetical protein
MHLEAKMNCELKTFLRPNRNRCDNINIVEYEKSDNMKDLLENWNISTNKWLKYYVYLRLSKPGERPTFIALFATFLTSAVWHGLYPGYYLTFISGALLNPVSKALHRQSFFQGKVGWLFTHFILNYIIAPFVALSLQDSIRVWSSQYFVGHILLAIAFVYVRITTHNKKKKTVTISALVETQDSLATTAKESQHDNLYKRKVAENLGSEAAKVVKSSLLDTKDAILSC